jgi:hypothetical protein
MRKSGSSNGGRCEEASRVAPSFLRSALVECRNKRRPLDYPKHLFFVCRCCNQQPTDLKAQELRRSIAREAKMRRVIARAFALGQS